MRRDYAKLCAKFSDLAYFSDETLGQYNANRLFPESWELRPIINGTQWANGDISGLNGTWIALSAAAGRSGSSSFRLNTDTSLDYIDRPGYIGNIGRRVLFFVNREIERDRQIVKVIVAVMGSSWDFHAESQNYMAEFVFGASLQFKTEYDNYIGSQIEPGVSYEYEFILTGHAFSGYLASLLYLKNHSNNRRKITFSSAYVFDSPGVDTINLEDYDNDGICLYNFIHRPHLMNSIGRKYGKLYFCPQYVSWAETILGVQRYIVNEYRFLLESFGMLFIKQENREGGFSRENQAGMLNVLNQFRMRLFNDTQERPEIRPLEVRPLKRLLSHALREIRKLLGMDDEADIKIKISHTATSHSMSGFIRALEGSSNIYQLDHNKFNEIFSIEKFRSDRMIDIQDKFEELKQEATRV